jgi:hypothetical protein
MAGGISVLPRYTGACLVPVTQLPLHADLLSQRRCGHIVVKRTRLVAVYGRWWPYYGNLLQAAWDGHFRRDDDSCEIFYHVPWSTPQYLTLSYIRSGGRATAATVKAACLVLDEIARIRQASAIVCHVTNNRISDRTLERWGWESHCPHLPGRHFIKRFYGRYPEISSAWKVRLGLWTDILYS